jgi:hypothetical protein
MTTDVWNGNGDWNLNTSDWSLGAPPTSSTPAEIQSGTSTISTSGAAEWLTIDSGATLTLDNGVTFATTKWLDNAGTWNLGAGDKVKTGGRLTNSGGISIGATNLSTSTTLRATTLTNTGFLDLQGNASSGTTHKASVILSGAAASTLSGSVQVSGDATLQFGSGEITTVGSGASLELDGAAAQILTGGGSSSALSDLTANHGLLVLQGDANLENLGSGGVTLTTTTAFTNYGDVWVDSFASFDGGSVVTFGGTLTNDGLLNIGITDLSASTTVNATTFVNSGTLDLQGNATSGTTDKASLVLSGAAVSTLTGTVDVTGDATLQFASGRITTIGSGASLDLIGSGAQILTGRGASSALSGLTANYGTLSLQGDTVNGAGGATLTTTTAFTNYGTAHIDTEFAGRSAVTFGGALTNDGTFQIGSNDLIASTTVSASRLVNNGTLEVRSDTTAKASLVLSGAAAATWTGTAFIFGNATLQFASGGITTIGSGASLDLIGSGAQILTNGGASSALSGLTSNEGTLELQGSLSDAPGGVALTTTKAFTNHGAADVDSDLDCGGARRPSAGRWLTTARSTSATPTSAPRPP